MMKSARRFLWTLGLVTTLSAAHASAFQTPSPDGGATKPAEVQTEKSAAPSATSAAPAATVERIMAQAVRNIAVRYNLNAEQSAETRKIMTDRVHQFLREHEDQVWPVIRELIAGGFKPSTDKDRMMKTGKTAVDLMKMVKEAILEGNEEWRYVLTPEQKKLHDYDLSDMERQFETINKNFEDWATGKYTNKPVFPQPRVLANQPARPTKPRKGLPGPDIGIPTDPNYVFDAIVEEFIQEYALDDGQITAAQSILQEHKAKANDYRSAQRAEFARNLADQHEARAQRDRDAVKETREAYKKLLEPIHDLCGKMEERLMAQLTTAQIQRHEENVRTGKIARKGAAKLAAEKSVAQPRKTASKEAQPARERETGAKTVGDDG